MPSWPGSLPQKPLFDTWNESPADNLVRFQPDVGPEKRRRRTTRGRKVVSCQFLMTGAEVAVLDTFYETTLQDGALAFDWDHPRTDVNKSWAFTEPYDLVCVGPDDYRITVKLSEQ